MSIARYSRCYSRLRRSLRQKRIRGLEDEDDNDDPIVAAAPIILAVVDGNEPDDQEEDLDVVMNPEPDRQGNEDLEGDDVAPNNFAPNNADFGDDFDFMNDDYDLGIQVPEEIQENGDENIARDVGILGNDPAEEVAPDNLAREEIPGCQTPNRGGNEGEAGSGDQNQMQGVEEQPAQEDTAFENGDENDDVIGDQEREENGGEQQEVGNNVLIEDDGNYSGGNGLIEQIVLDRDGGDEAQQDNEDPHVIEAFRNHEPAGRNPPEITLIPAPIPRNIDPVVITIDDDDDDDEEEEKEPILVHTIYIDDPSSVQTHDRKDVLENLYKLGNAIDHQSVKSVVNHINEKYQLCPSNQRVSTEKIVESFDSAVKILKRKMSTPSNKDNSIPATRIIPMFIRLVEDLNSPLLSEVTQKLRNYDREVCEKEGQEERIPVDMVLSAITAILDGVWLLPNIEINLRRAN